VITDRRSWRNLSADRQLWVPSCWLYFAHDLCAPEASRIALGTVRPIQRHLHRDPADNRSMQVRWKPSVTVAAVIERDGQFLLVEEHTPEGLRLNNPAGHLDPGESLVEACVRETLEETAFTFVPSALVGIYMSRFQRTLPAPSECTPTLEDITYLRFAFCGSLGAWDAHRTLDTGIVRTLWLTPDAIRQTTANHRSPLVLQCMEDFLRGQRFALDAICTDRSVYL